MSSSDPTIQDDESSNLEAEKFLNKPFDERKNLHSKLQQTAPEKIPVIIMKKKGSKLKNPKDFKYFY